MERRQAAMPMPYPGRAGSAQLPAEVEEYSGSDITYGDVVKDCLCRLARNDETLQELKLAKYSLRDTHMKLLWLALKDNTHLTELNLSHNKIKDEGLQWVWNLIRDNAYIKKLNLAHNGFHSASIRRLDPVVRANISLVSLRLEEQTLGRLLSRKNGKFHFGGVLEENQKLDADEKPTEICLVERCLQDVPSRILGFHGTQSLDLSRNFLLEIPPAIRQLSLLTALTMPGNCLLDVPMELSLLTNLQQIDLSDNMLTSVPFGLATIKSLQVVDLSDNFLSPAGVPLASIEGTSQGLCRIVALEKNASTMKMPFDVSCHWVTPRLIIVGDTRLGGFLQGLQLINRSNKPSDHLQPAVKRLMEQDSGKDVSSFTFSVDQSKATGGRKRAATTPVRCPQETSKDGFARSAKTEEAAAGENWGIRCLDVGEHAVGRLLLSKEMTVFTITFDVAERTMADIVEYLTKWMSELTGDMLPDAREGGSGSPTQTVPLKVLLVGTYSSEELEKSVLKRRMDLLQQTFGSTAQVASVCTQSGAGVNALQAQLACAIASTMQDKESAPLCYRLLMERMRMERERCHIEQKPAVLPWARFLEIAAECEVEEKKVDDAARFLLQTGEIIHYRDLACRPVSVLSVDAVRDWVFLDESVPRLAIDLVEQNVAAVQSVPLVNRKHLRLYWMDIPAELHPVLLILFEHFGVLSPVMTTHQAAKNRDVVYVVPSMASHNSVRVGTRAIRYFVSPAFLYGPKSSPAVGRIAQFTALPPALFGRVLAELVGSLDKEIGTLANVGDGYLQVVGAGVTPPNWQTPDFPKRWQAGAVVVFDNADARMSCFAWEAGGTNLLQHMVELLNRVVEEEGFAKRLEKWLIPCIHCYSKGRDLDSCSMFNLHDIEQGAVNGQRFVHCEIDDRCGVRIDVIAPDVTLPETQFKFDDVEMGPEVGKGGYGIVYRATMKDTGKAVAVKMINFFGEEDEMLAKFAEFRHEVNLMRGLVHRNLVSLLGICREPLCLVTDFCPEGDLSSLLEEARTKEKALSLEYVQMVLLDIAKGMEFLHSRTPPMLHLDLKSPNILLMQKPHGWQRKDREAGTEGGDGEDKREELVVANPELPVALVADFGVSNRSFLPKSERVVDNPLWLAPEVMQSKPYSTPSDVYGFGIIANELLTLKLPFESFNEKFSFRLEDRIIAGEREEVPEWCPQYLKTLITSCWQSDPSLRPSFAMVVATLEEATKKDGGDAGEEREEAEVREKKEKEERGVAETKVEKIELASPTLDATQRKGGHDGEEKEEGPLMAVGRQSSKSPRKLKSKLLGSKEKKRKKKGKEGDADAGASAVPSQKLTDLRMSDQLARRGSAEDFLAFFSELKHSGEHLAAMPALEPVAGGEEEAAAGDSPPEQKVRKSKSKK